MKKYISAFLLIFIFLSSYAQMPEIPEEIEFAGMKLELSESVRKLIQTDMANILRNPQYLKVKVERANLYFPIIEKVFQEENFPSDFKYLALQESSLVSDAISSSNAVGYWQFKKETAREVGLRVDGEVDERMNIVSSSKGAAKYLKKNNAVLNNWVYTLLSYHHGLGGVKSEVEEKYRGANRMKIDKDMHWYVLRFFAHKLAYEKMIGAAHSTLKLVEFNECANKSLRQISEEKKVSLEDLQLYNKWVLGSRIPEDKMYVVVLPYKISEQPQEAIVKNETKVKIKTEGSETKIKVKNKKEHGRVAPPGYDPYNPPLVITHNELKAVKARSKDNFATIAYGTGISLEEFLRINDLEKYDQIVPGEFYYVEPKKTRALVLFHTVEAGETLKDISQKYGIRINSIKKKNRMKMRETPQVGRVLWLNKRRPKHTEIEVKNVIREKAQPAIQEAPSVIPSKDTEEISDETDHEIGILPIKEQSDSHIVQKGQTLYSISKMYNINLDSIKSWNGKIIQNELKIGDTLQLKNLKQAQPNNSEDVIVHIIKKGDTVYKLSQLYKVSVADILKWNHKSDSSVSTDDKIIIYKVKD